MTPALALDGTHRLAVRDYQHAVIEASAAAEARGVRRQLLVMATGLGKTIVFVVIAARRGERTLVVAHRDELIQQAADKVRLWWPDADIGIVKAARNDAWAQDVVVASIQSLNARRMASLGRFGLVVIDEAHHCGAPSYERVLDALGCGPNEQRPDAPLLLGVTATADRGDGKGLDKVFDEIVATYDIVWGIRSGYLVDVRAVEVKLADLDLAGVTVRQGDYADGALGAALTDANAPRHIVRAWKAHASDRLTVAFMPTVANAAELAAEFNANGIRAAMIDGTTPLDIRRHRLADLEAGRIRVVSNCGVLTEGFDCPELACIIPKPTKSRSLFTQMVGRGTRPFPGKDDLLVLDTSGATENKDLCCVPSLFGMTKRQMGPKPATKAIDDIEAAREAELARGARKPAERDGTLVARDIDLFRKMRKAGKVAWGRMRHGGYAVSLPEDHGKRRSVVIDPMGEVDGEQRYRVVVVGQGDDADTVLMEGVPLTLAQGIGEDHVRSHAPTALVSKKATWRGRAPTARQLEAAQRWGIVVEKDWTAGRVSEELDARAAAARLRRNRR